MQFHDGVMNMGIGGQFLRLTARTRREAAFVRDGRGKGYLHDIRRFAMLESDQEYKLAKRWREHGDRDAANKLVTSHLRLAAKIAMGYRGYGLPISEIISEGNVGLMQALNRFEPEKGFRFSTYAMWWIRASIQDYILRSWSLVKIGTTANQKKLFFKLRSAKSKIAAFESGDLNPDQVALIAKDLDVTDQDVIAMNRRPSKTLRSNSKSRASAYGKSRRVHSRKCEKRPRTWPYRRRRTRVGAPEPRSDLRISLNNSRRSIER